MSSDKRKGGTSRAQTAKALPKQQRTLLDSFVTRVPSKAVPLELESVGGNMQPPATTDLRLGGPSNTIDIGVSLKEETNNMEALVPSSDSHGSPNLGDNGRRSPSIIIIEDTPELRPAVLKQTPLINSQEYNANASGKAKDFPIIIDSSPIQCRSSSEPDKKPIHPFFLPKFTHAVQPPQMHSIIVGRKAVGAATPPNASLFFPQGIPQHVRGLQTTFACGYSPLPARPQNICGQATDKVANYDFLKSPAVEEPSPVSYRVLLPIGGNDPANIIPEDIKAAHPAVARLIDLKPGDKPTSNRPWADRWRPSCAQEVLGNEQSAIYLRDWLRALELQLEETGTSCVPADSLQNHKKLKVNGKTINRGTKRPRVIRAVDKTRRKRSRLDSDEDEDNWIVYTDNDDEEEDARVNYDQFDEFGEITLNDPPASSPSSSVHESQQASEKYERSSYLGQLHNTILLTGPPGCGKTASVYACAEELGWDIFEVYPGIGRRNAANIDNLIGEVGKNHLVLQSRPSGDSLKSFLQSKAQGKSIEENEEYNALSQISPRKKSSVGVNTEVPQHDKQSIKSVQQSLILLEEVDILFKEDTNFWTTVMKIIRECKRPVVCTCNDLSLVPVQDLPLQATLFYTPCPEGPAACYLQALCAGEGYAVSWKDLLTLYTNPQRTPFTFNHTPDLRATINTLQAISVDAANAVEAGQQKKCGRPQSSLVPPRISVEGSDSLSFLDGSLDQNIASTYCVLTELGNHVPSDDDETGHIILFDRHAEDTASFEIYERQREMFAAAAQLVNSVFGMDISRGMENSGQKVREGQRVAAREICRIAEDPVSVSLEYLPYVRQIVEAEDMLEIQEQEKRARVGRMTRNSTRSQYVRMVELTEQARGGVELSGLSW